MSRLHACVGALLLVLGASCQSAPGSVAPHVPDVPARRLGALDFLQSTLKPWPTPDAPTRLAVVTPGDTRVAIYDNALASLVLERRGRHDEAGRILEALALLQHPDGGLPFSFPIDRPESDPPYIRTGALSWVGYAAVEYLDGAPGGPARDAIVRMAHRIAAYLQARTVTQAGDPRQGLVTGGEGDLTYKVVEGALVEDVVPGAIAWASVEHNIDAFFFLRALGRLTGTRTYTDSAQRLGQALVARAWDGGAGQLRRGLSPTGPDPVLALDCASWGSLFLQAAGEPTRAETAFATGDSRFASTDPATGVSGHRPYARGAVIEEEPVAAFYAKAKSGPPADWAQLQAVWPEGSAGVALAALRAGHRDRAVAILNELERLREPGGGLPMMTVDVPYEFDRKPAVAGTVWVELVRAELEASAPFLWRP